MDKLERLALSCSQVTIASLLADTQAMLVLVLATALSTAALPAFRILEYLLCRATSYGQKQQIHYKEYYFTYYQDCLFYMYYALVYRNEWQFYENSERDVIHCIKCKLTSTLSNSSCVLNSRAAIST